MASAPVPDKADLIEQVAEARFNLQDFPFMPLDIHRLLTSETWIEAAEDPKIGHALICLWASSWHQVPASSLPDNDTVLSRLAMCDPETWARIKERVMRGWVRWKDGRFYHPTVAEKALEAGKRKEAHRAKTVTALRVRLEKLAHKREIEAKISEERIRKRLAKQELAEGSRHVNVTSTSRQRHVNVTSNRQGQGQGQGQGERKEKPQPIGQPLPLENQIGRIGLSAPASAPAGSPQPRTEPELTLALTPDQNALPSWLDPHDWDAFVKHRKEIRKPLTKEGAKRAIAKLDQLRSAGQDPHKVIDASIVNGWSGLFATREALASSSSTSLPQIVRDPTKGYR